MTRDILTKTVLLLFILITFLSAGELGPTWGEKGKWYKAHLTWYESYPPEHSMEYVKYSGGEYLGTFAFLDYQQSQKWVQENNIIAVHSDHGKWLGLEKLRLRTDSTDESSELVATVYDVCSDTDCGGCCTRNAGETGYLIDLEIHTMRRFGYSKDVYPEYVYFKIYETDKQEKRRLEKEKKKELRQKKREEKNANKEKTSMGTEE